MAETIIEQSFQCPPGVYPTVQDNDVSVFAADTRAGVVFDEPNQTAGFLDGESYNVYDLRGYSSQYLEEAKLTFRAYQTNSTDFDWNIFALTSFDIWNYQYWPSTDTNHVSGRFTASLKSATGDLSSQNAAHLTGNTWMRCHMDERNNISLMKLDQVLGINQDGEVFEAQFRMRRGFAGIGTGRMWVELWTIAGSPGNYRAHTLISSGEEQAKSLSLGFGWSLQQFFPYPIGNPPTVNIGDRVILRLVIETDGNYGANSYIDVNASTDPTQVPGQGYNSNMVITANPGLLTGFALSTNYLSANDIRDHVDNTMPILRMPNPLPPTIEGQTWTVGNAFYSPDTEVDLARLIRAALDDTTSGYICLKTQASGNDVNTEWRSWHSTRSATETVDGLLGLVLTLRWVIPDQTEGLLDTGRIRTGEPIAAATKTAEPVAQRHVTRDTVSATLATRDLVDSRQTTRQAVDAVIGTGQRRSK